MPCATDGANAKANQLGRPFTAESISSSLLDHPTATLRSGVNSIGRIVRRSSVARLPPERRRRACGIPDIFSRAPPATRTSTHICTHTRTHLATMMPSRGWHLAKGTAPRVFQAQCRNVHLPHCHSLHHHHTHTDPRIAALLRKPTDNTATTNSQSLEVSPDTAMATVSHPRHRIHHRHPTCLHHARRSSSPFSTSTLRPRRALIHRLPQPRHHHPR